jgi:hypothetical protein
MIPFVVFDKDTKRIKRTGYASNAESALAQAYAPGEEAAIPEVEKIDNEEDMVAGNGPAAPLVEPILVDVTMQKIVKRPIMNLVVNKTTLVANGQDVITIAGYPVPSKLMIEGPFSTTVNLTDPQFGFTTELKGEYKLMFRGFPYRRKEITLAAT